MRWRARRSGKTRRRSGDSWPRSRRRSGAPVAASWAPATCALLWWDGVRWTEHVTIPGAGAGAGDVPPVATDSGAVEPVEPVDGPRALSDEAVDLLFEGLVADYRFRWRFFSFGVRTRW